MTISERLTLIKRQLPKVISFIGLTHSWWSYVSLAGTAGLAAIGIEDVRAQTKPWIPGPVWEWASGNQIVVVLILAVAAVAPAAIRPAIIQHKQIARDVQKNLEMSTYSRSLSARTAHLITKKKDVDDGVRDKAYIAHTLRECAAYLKERAINVSGLDSSERVEASLLRIVCTNNGRDRVERYAQTQVDTGEFPGKLSTHNMPAENRRFLKRLRDEQYTFVEAQADVAQTWSIFGMGSAPAAYAQFLFVPVLLDRKAEGIERTWGTLVVTSTAAGALRETDATLIQTYAWFLSAALAFDPAR